MSQKEPKEKKKSDSKVEPISDTKIENAEKKQEEVKEKPEEVAKVSSDTDEKAPSEEDKEKNLFRLNDSRFETNIVVKGTIALASINEKTRPVRKSRAQRKKERLEREGTAASQKVKDENLKALKKESIDEKKKKPGLDLAFERYTVSNNKLERCIMSNNNKHRSDA